MTQTPVAGQDRPCGLRERKKARTRAAIRRHALRLFREQGYHRTTVEQIAAAAEVSPSTFFRYFPTKEDLILQDDVDTQVVEAFERQPAGLKPVAAFRAALREVAGSFSQAELDVIRETTAHPAGGGLARRRSVHHRHVRAHRPVPGAARGGPAALRAPRPGPGPAP